MPRLGVDSDKTHEVSNLERLFDLPLNARVFKLIITRQSWPVLPGKPPASEVVRYRVDVSLDGGRTWSHGAGGGAEGGDNITRTGAVSPQTTLKYSLPEPDNPNRKVRVQIRFRARVRCKIDLDVE